jgi:hypothetical protein
MYAEQDKLVAICWRECCSERKISEKYKKTLMIIKNGM